MNAVQKGKNNNLTVEKYDRPYFNEMITVNITLVIIKLTSCTILI